MNPQAEQIRRAAMLVAALDADAADALLDRLSAEQAGLVRRVLVEIDDVDPHEQRTIIQAFLAGTAPDGRGSEPTVEYVAPEAPVPHVAQAPTFGFLHEADVEDLRELLAGERPQTVAVVISHLPADRAAEVLATLAPPLQADVCRRLASLHEADPDVLGDIEAGLQMRFRKKFVRGDRAAGVGAVQDILSEAAPPLRQTLLSAISRQDPRLAERLTRPTRPPLGFADLPRLSHDSLRLLFDSIDEEYAAVALAGAEADFAARLTAPLPRARIERLQATIDSLGPTPLGDIELAQDELACVARELDTAGRLTWREAPTGRSSTGRSSSDGSSTDGAARRTAAA
jgi:flagellar motor switch protein FliG